MKLTYTAYFVQATVAAIKAVPEANSRWRDDGLELFVEMHIGIATSLGNGGLIVPVLRNAQAHDLEAPARGVQELAYRARAGTLSPSEVQGGTFSISNHGVSGSLVATPIIINQPQSAILGVGKLEPRAVVRDWQIVARPMFYVTLTIDHRVLDGFSANAFLSRWVEAIEQWTWEGANDPLGHHGEPDRDAAPDRDQGGADRALPGNRRHGIRRRHVRGARPGRLRRSEAAAAGVLRRHPAGVQPAAGVRIRPAPSPFKPDGPVGKRMEAREPLVLNTRAQADALGVGTIPGTDASLSGVFVPIVGSDRVLGSIVLENYAREHAFGESEVRLLTTVAAGMGVALENARLFDETQRRTRETAALAKVGRDISSTLDVATVMDRIARHAKELLHCDNSAIFLPEAGGQTFRAIVAVGEVAEQIRAAEIRAGSGIIGSLLEAGVAEFINDTRADPRAVQIAGTERREHERLMVAPLLAGTIVKGAMAVWRTGGRLFDAAELEFLVGHRFSNPRGSFRGR